MADQTQGAVDALLGLLTTAIKDEARLIAGVPGAMQFIKDEMDSMNGFLLHLTQMEVVHDSQVRAWMKQVREIAYISEDCVERYVRDIAPLMESGGCGVCGCLVVPMRMVRLFLFEPKKFWALHRLGKQIEELKLRVREVGERRKRYDVSVPAGQKLVLKPTEDDKAEERERFQDELRREEEAWRTRRQQQQAQAQAPLGLGIGLGVLVRRIGQMLPLPAAPPLMNKSIRKLLPKNVRSEASTVHGILKRCWPAVNEAAALSCIKMFLRALHAYPYDTNLELNNLLKKLEEAEVGEGVGLGAPQTEAKRREQVMIFCYSMLSTQQKGCLQYLTAFLYEKEISRTSMIRRWVAEGLLGKEQAGGGTTTLEEAGERCFIELVFRGFVRPSRTSDAGTVKSCVMEEPVQDFIRSITQGENFVVELPAHLDRQLKIRKIVQGEERSLPPLPPPTQLQARRRWRNAVRHCKLRSSSTRLLLPPGRGEEEDASKDPMDKLVDFLKSLPELYRLNVLDLGGCRGLKRRHVKSFGSKVVWLKYLSLRKTDVSHLEADHINRLTLLETLDIRETSIPSGDTKKIYLKNLKHLLADRRDRETSSLATVQMQMPDKIGYMKNMETLSHVQVSKDGTELEEVVRLRSPQQLRKLGVVVHGDQTTAAYLGRVLCALAGCLRSLSVWVTQTHKGGGGALDMSTFVQPLAETTASSLVLQNLDIKGKITELPPWIGRAQKLINVTLRDTQVNGGDALRRLGSVPSLSCLKLIREAFTDQALIFVKDDYVVHQFKALKILVVEGSEAITSMAFTAADAVPNLEKIVWVIIGGSRTTGKGGNSHREDEDLIVISGIDNLPRLKVIELRGDFKVAKLMEAKATSPAPPKPKYHCRYISPSDVVEIPKTASDTTLSLPRLMLSTGSN